MKPAMLPLHMRHSPPSKTHVINPGGLDATDMPAKTHTHVIKPGGLDTSSVPANPQLGFSTPGVGNASANVTGGGFGAYELGGELYWAGWESEGGPDIAAVHDGSDSDAMICPLVLITTALLPLAYRTCTCHRSYIRQEDLSWTKPITMLSQLHASVYKTHIATSTSIVM